MGYEACHVKQMVEWKRGVLPNRVCHSITCVGSFGSQTLLCWGIETKEVGLPSISLNTCETNTPYSTSTPLSLETCNLFQELLSLGRNASPLSLLKP